MSRRTTFTIAIILLASAIGIGFWRNAKTRDEIEPSPTIANQQGTPRVHKVDSESIYRKLTDSSIRWEVRVDMLRRIEVDRLKSQDIDTLFSLLRYQPTAGQEQSWWVVVNEIMEQMRIHAIGSDRYGKELLSIMRDHTSPEILRDYAVQHLGQWVSPRGAQLGQPSEQDPEIIRETAETLAMLAMDTDTTHTSISGTSLMVLVDMKGGGVSKEVIDPVIASLQPWFAATLAGSNQAGKITRISAINAVGMLHLDAFLPQIRTLAISENMDSSLRLNSIATLGLIGQPSDMETLETIAKSDIRFQYAAQTALQKLTIKHP